MEKDDAVADQNDSVQCLAAAAAAFCHWVDRYPSFAGDNKNWLQALGPILLRLETAIQPLEHHTREAEYSMLQDLEERFIFCQRMKGFLGPLDEYWSEGDLEAGDGLKTGSLADDITDLYFDVKRGLDLYQSDTEMERRALDLWLYSYHIHWRQHLREVLKQLYVFRAAS